MQKKAFTLIELMVVIGIIAVLAAVIAPQVFRQVAKGRVASAEAFHNSVKVAATSYFSDIGAWPVNVNGFTISPGGAAGAGWDGPYLDRWPVGASNPWRGTYTYTNTAGSAVFGIAAAPERYMNIANVPMADAIRIDRDIDRVVGNATGMVRYPAVGANVIVNILISRDGPIS